MIILLVLITIWVLIAPGCMTFQVTDEKAKSDFKKKGLILNSGNLQVLNRDIYYTSIGNDSLPTLFFLHGSPGTWSAFADYMEDPEMLFHFRMIGIDRPGFGYSNKGGALNLADQSRILLPVIKHFNNNKPAFLAGHSLGAPLALKMAADLPGYFSGLALISTPLDPSLEETESWRKLFNHFPLEYLLPGAFRPSNTELLYFKKDVIALGADLEKIDCSIYLIHGEQDKWVPVANTIYAENKLIHASRISSVIIPGSNHFIPWSQKKEIKKVLIQMLDSTSISR